MRAHKTCLLIAIPVLLAISSPAEAGWQDAPLVEKPAAEGWRSGIPIEEPEMPPLPPGFVLEAPPPWENDPIVEENPFADPLGTQIEARIEHRITSARLDLGMSRRDQELIALALALIATAAGFRWFPRLTSSITSFILVWLVSEQAATVLAAGLLLWWGFTRKAKQ